MTQPIAVDQSDGVLTLTFNRPDKKNAITAEMYRLLAEGLERADRDPSVRAVLLLGAGGDFTAGNDISTFANHGQAPQSDEPPPVQQFLEALARARKPLVAGVRGRAVGIGLTLLLHCDLVIVARDAGLSAPFVNLAVSPEAASSLLLVARVGHLRAFSIFATGQVVSGELAAAWGLANEALPAEDVDAAARRAAIAMAHRPIQSLIATKGLMRDTEALLARISQETEIFSERLGSAEAQEAFRAFAERRAPNFAAVET